MLDSRKQVARASGEQLVSEAFKPLRFSEDHRRPRVRYRRNGEQAIAFRELLKGIVGTKRCSTHLCATRPERPVEYTEAPSFSLFDSITRRQYSERALQARVG